MAGVCLNYKIIYAINIIDLISVSFGNSLVITLSLLWLTFHQLLALKIVSFHLFSLQIVLNFLHVAWAILKHCAWTSQMIVLHRWTSKGLHPIILIGQVWQHLFVHFHGWGWFSILREEVRNRWGHFRYRYVWPCFLIHRILWDLSFITHK